MYIKNNLRRLIIASVIAGSLAFTPDIYSLPIIVPIAQAKVQMYEGIAEDYPSEIESQDISKLRARNKAIRKAVEKAGIYLKSYSRTINAVLQDDEISAIASNSYQLIGDVKYERITKQVTEESSVIIWKATVNVNVDDSEIQSWLKREEKDRSTIVTQTKENQKATEENDKQVEELRKRAENIKTEQDKPKLEREFIKVGNEFLAIQRNDEAVQLGYQKYYQEAIKKLNEALELKPNFDWAYYNRGVIYVFLKNYKMAKNDFDKAIQINPNLDAAYNNRGIIYSDSKKYEQAMADYNKAIELNPNNADPYNNRGNAYFNLQNYKQAIEDYTKAIQINPIFAGAYYNRGSIYTIAIS